MTHRLSDSTIKEINEFFAAQNYTKNHLTMDVRKANEMMLRSCGFVYIADRGSVIHANSLCGTWYNSLVPIDIALKYGYTRPCKTCACGTYVESLLRERGKI